MAKRKSSTSRVLKKRAEPSPTMDYSALVSAIEQAHQTAQHHAAQAVNVLLTLRNWLVGYHIVEYEQHGSNRAKYGERLLEQLAKDLRHRLGRGFAQRNLRTFRGFYRRYPIRQSLIAEFGIDLSLTSSATSAALDWQDDAYFGRLFHELPWTHFTELIRMDDPLKRSFYEVESLKNRWSVRELKRQIASLLYERVGLSRDQVGVLELAKEGELVRTPADLIRDPYVFEFLGLKREERYSESQLEQALLDHLQEFLLELGEGFCFVARQQRITFDNEHYYIDLLLYNRRLKCLVAVVLIGHTGEKVRLMTRAPKVRHSIAQANGLGNGSIAHSKPQRGVTRIQDWEFRPVGAANRIVSLPQAVGLGYRVTHLWC